MSFLDLPPSFYVLAVLGVLFTGIAKGGLGGALAMLGTPFLALMISPLQAAAIMLPILLLMDAISLYSYWGRVNWSILKVMIPGALVGLGIAWSTVSMVSDNAIRIVVGMIAILFAAYQVFRELRKLAPKQPNAVLGSFWGMVAGFTSFIAHAGGPPYQTYTVPLKMDKVLFVGTSVVFFAVVNVLKVIPYFALGQFDPQNLTTSLLLMPVAVIGVVLGVWMVKRVSQEFFYRLTYVVLFLVGAKLVYDGVAGV